ncbi:DUF4115 domain-containing protein [Microaerobacter geothermalis]|uniref:helix-turn-helix domain-containing protein n=1 Tax=Microaerobacter geothermalis TaxID=674972 RepID=UPI001F21B356|nr:helix-turn-helix domain-containing protein [Microaerobacter geothermalis]MCF6093156.1 DUF4115 domain-containing protein [Microaerobacter geothermalis]
MNELGELLKRTRMEKNISLAEVQEHTKIQVRYLEAIENGQWNILPGKFYTRAFIKKYAEFLGMDYHELRDQYQHLFPQNEEEELQPVKRQRASSPPFEGVSRWITKILLYAFVILIFIVIYIAVVQTMNPKDEKLSPDPDTSIIENQNPARIPDGPSNPPVENNREEPAPPPQPALSLVKEEGINRFYELTNANQIEISLTASRGDCWFELRDATDGKLIEMMTLKMGETKTWTLDNNQVRLQLGWPPSADLLVNGQIIPTKDVQSSGLEIYITLKK